MPNRSFVVSAILLLSLSEFVQAKGPFNLDVLRRDGYGVVQLSLRDNQFSVPVTVNGQKVRLILDTGYSGGIGLDSHMANVKVTTEGKGVKGYGLSGKAVEGHRGTAQTVAMGNVRLTEVPVEVAEFTALSQSHADTFSSRWAFDTSMGTAPSGEGLIGRSFLHTNHAVIDLANRMLYLRPPGTGRSVQLASALTNAGMGQAAINNGNMVDIDVNGVAGKMVVDTGAFVSVIDPRFAARAKLSSGWGVQDLEINDIANVKTRADLTGLRNLKIAGIPARDATVSVMPFSGYSASGGKIAGLFGLDFLGKNWSIIDFAQDRLYFAKAR